MIPLDSLWHWLHCNVEPSADTTKDMALCRAVATQDFFTTLDKQPSPGEQSLADVLMYRMLTSLYPHISMPPSVWADPIVCALQRVPVDKVSERSSSVPLFPQELQQSLLQELRIEIVARQPTVAQQTSISTNDNKRVSGENDITLPTAKRQKLEPHLATVANPFAEAKLKMLEDQCRAMRTEVADLRNVLEEIQQRNLSAQPRSRALRKSVTKGKKTPSKRKIEAEVEDMSEEEEEEEDHVWAEDWEEEDREWGSENEGKMTTRMSQTKNSSKAKKGGRVTNAKTQRVKPAAKSVKTKKSPAPRQQKKPKTQRSNSDQFSDEHLAEGPELIFSPTSYHVTSISTASPISPVSTSRSKTKLNSGLATHQQIQEVQALSEQQEHLLDSLRESPFKSFFEETDLAKIDSKPDDQDRPAIQTQQQHHQQQQQQQQQQLLLLQRQQQLQQRQLQQQLLQQQIQKNPTENHIHLEPPQLQEQLLQMHQSHLHNSNLQAQLLKAQLQAQLDPALQHAQLLPQWPPGVVQWPPAQMHPLSPQWTLKWAQTQAMQALAQSRVPTQPQTILPQTEQPVPVDNK